MSIDSKTEVEVAGVQLIHLPFWQVQYIYQPQSLIRHIQKPSHKNLIVEGYAGGVLKSELSMIHRDKIWINTAVSGVATLLLFFIGSFVHSSFLLVSIIMLIITGVSAYVASTRKVKNPTSSFFHSAEEKLEIQGAESKQIKNN